MKKYIALFHSHFGAIAFKKSLNKNNIMCELGPVPRYLSSSCGTCVFFECEEFNKDIITDDVEKIYEEDGTEKKLVYEEED